MSVRFKTSCSLRFQIHNLPVPVIKNPDVYRGQIELVSGQHDVDVVVGVAEVGVLLDALDLVEGEGLATHLYLQMGRVYSLHLVVLQLPQPPCQDLAETELYSAGFYSITFVLHVIRE